MLKLLLSAEFFYIVFLFSGVFKESVSTRYDISIIFLVLVVTSVVWKVIQKPKINKGRVYPLILFPILLIIILMSVLINNNYDTSIVKLVKFTFLTMPSFLLPLFFVNDKNSIKRILWSVSFLSVVLSLFSVSAVLSKGSLFIGFNEGNYLGLARLTGYGFIALSYFLLIVKKKNKPFVLICLLLVSFILLSTGSRMPLLAIVLSSIYAILKSFKITKSDLLIKKKLVSGFGLVGLLSLSLPYFYSKGYFETIFYRFGVLVNGGGDSVSGRVDRVDSAIRMFKENVLIGGGFGDFGKYYWGEKGVYAHNIFLEFLSELGLLGTLWFMIFILSIISVLLWNKRLKSDSLLVTLTVSFVFFFLNSMVSGDINDNRALFSCSSLLFIYPLLKDSDTTINLISTINDRKYARKRKWLVHTAT